MQLTSRDVLFWCHVDTSKQENSQHQIVGFLQFFPLIKVLFTSIKVPKLQIKSCAKTLLDIGTLLQEYSQKFKICRELHCRVEGRGSESFLPFSFQLTAILYLYLVLKDREFSLEACRLDKND